MNHTSPPLPRSRLGRTGFEVSRIGFGAFKLGRNQGIKYPQGYELPDEREAAELLNRIVDLGINLIDTAPAYGVSEERVGRALASRRNEIVLGSKVGETFQDGQSTFDFSRAGIESSVERSLRRLDTDHLDLLFLHSNGEDLKILNETDAVETLLDLRTRGLVRAIGMSGKLVEGARQSLVWADALMVEFHVDDTSHAEVIKAAAAAGVGIIVKKGLASGHLPAADALRFVLGQAAVSSVVVGSLSLEHIQSNIAVAAESSGSAD